jgi:hypothetical protein
LTCCRRQSRNNKGEDAVMPTRNRVKGETVRVEAGDGSASIALELSRAGPVRSSFARAVCTGRARSSSSSMAASAPAGQQAKAAAGGLRRKAGLPD